MGCGSGRDVPDAGCQGITGQHVVDAARSWLGTPFHHQGRTRGIGVDCVGLTIGIASELGLISDDDVATLPTNYRARPDTELMRRLLNQHMQKVDIANVGDWIWISAPGNPPTHVALVCGERSMIHACAATKEVVEHPLRPAHRRMAKACFRYPGVTHG